ncbi:MAG: cysteine hydrolase [Pseudonocardia sp.]|uniref:cysteine hydrolase family protein n=1 Tax=unclassified Pseudonocardia TaxID=2619320 RepID=UPI001ACD15A0|nr:MULTISPECIES: isochorismatase family cysteine hydrolase [unclassified Pseudonocardia]MBN9108337.1 cysteine hydrolase [Pseudonocardia sp.]
MTIEAALAALLAGIRRGPRHGPGRRLCVVVVDMQVLFVEGAGDSAHAAVAATARLLAQAREAGVPVYLVRVVHDDLTHVDPAWAARFDLEPLRRGRPTAEFDPRLGPHGRDVIVEKHHASAFAGTDLAERLAATDVDTVLLCGLTTSGCVRATAVDGAALGLRMQVVADCVADQRQLSGPVALADLQDRYADVIDIREAAVQLRQSGPPDGHG